MSVRPYIGLEKFLVFVFLSICVSWDNGCRNYPIHLKFNINVYVFSEIRCLNFGVHCPNSAHRGIRGLHGPDFLGSGSGRPAWQQSRPGPARSKNKNFGLDPVQPERKIEILAWAWPGHFFFRFYESQICLTESLKIILAKPIVLVSYSHIR